MNQSPYESPRGLSDFQAKQKFPWSWLLVAGVLTSVSSFLAVVAIILSGETPTGMELSQTSIAAIVGFNALSLIGAAVVVIAAVGWLLSWFRN